MSACLWGGGECGQVLAAGLQRLLQRRQAGPQAKGQAVVNSRAQRSACPPQTTPLRCVPPCRPVLLPSQLCAACVGSLQPSSTALKSRPSLLAPAAIPMHLQPSPPFLHPSCTSKAPTSSSCSYAARCSKAEGVGLAASAGIPLPCSSQAGRAAHAARRSGKQAREGTVQARRVPCDRLPSSRPRGAVAAGLPMTCCWGPLRARVHALHVPPPPQARPCQLVRLCFAGVVLVRPHPTRRRWHSVASNARPLSAGPAHQHESQGGSGQGSALGGLLDRGEALRRLAAHDGAASGCTGRHCRRGARPEDLRRGLHAGGTSWIAGQGWGDAALDGLPGIPRGWMGLGKGAMGRRETSQAEIGERFSKNRG